MREYRGRRRIQPVPAQWWTSSSTVARPRASVLAPVSGVSAEASQWQQHNGSEEVVVDDKHVWRKMDSRDAAETSNARLESAEWRR